jgi:hypothetical protein
MKDYNGKPLTDPVIIFIALLNIALHLMFLNNLEYHRDELLYFSLGLHPAAGFATVPPLIGWISFIMQNLLGYSVFAVRLFPALLSGAMIFLSAFMAKELGGSRYSTFLASTALTISVFFMRSFSLFMPVFIEIFLWTLCIFLVIKYINSQKDKFLVFFGIAAGIALLNKYLVVILFTGLLLIIPFSRYRDVLRKKAFWAGLAAGFIIFLPNLIWQVSKGFPVFKHMSELYSRQLVHMDIPLFLTEQLLMPFAGVALTIAGLIFLIANKKAERFRFLGFLSAYVILILMILKGKSYYTLGVFPFLIVSGAVAYDFWLKKKWLRILLPFMLVLATLPVLPVGYPVFKQAGLIKYFKHVKNRFEDGSLHSLPQDYADMIGWEELTLQTNKAWLMVKDKKSCFIYCENYGQAGAITIIGKKYGLPESVCFNESFRYWIPKKFNPDITAFIYINDELGKDVQEMFKKITKIGSVSNPDAREFGTSVYLCEEPVGSFNEFWSARISRL